MLDACRGGVLIVQASICRSMGGLGGHVCKRIVADRGFGRQRGAEIVELGT